VINVRQFWYGVQCKRAELNDESIRRFILDCCRIDDDASAPVVGDLVGIEAAAYRHAIVPLVARRLRQTSADACDAPAHRLAANAQANALRNRYLLEQLQRILSVLQKAGIAALVLKGPVIAHLAYGDVGLRSFGDLDIVMRPGDLPAAAGLLDELGFDSYLYDAEAVETKFFNAAETNFHRREDRLNLDVHWELAPRSCAFGPTGEGIWEHAITIECEGITLSTPSNEDHLLYIAVHNARHGWESLSQVCDAAFFINRVPLDWETLLERAMVTRCTRMLSVALLLAHQVLTARVPPAVVAFAARDVAASKVAAQIGRELGGNVPSPGRFRNLGRLLRLMDRPVERFRYLTIGGFTPTMLDRSFVALRREFYPAYYLVRPVRLAIAVARLQRR
jgi:hypothetical protein